MKSSYIFNLGQCDYFIGWILFPCPSITLFSSTWDCYLIFTGRKPKHHLLLFQTLLYKGAVPSRRVYAVKSKKSWDRKRVVYLCISFSLINFCLTPRKSADMGLHPKSGNLLVTLGKKIFRENEIRIKCIPTQSYGHLVSYWT